MLEETVLQLEEQLRKNKEMERTLREKLNALAAKIEERLHIERPSFAFTPQSQTNPLTISEPSQLVPPRSELSSSQSELTQSQSATVPSLSQSSELERGERGGSKKRSRKKRNPERIPQLEEGAQPLDTSPPTISDTIPSLPTITDATTTQPDTTAPIDSSSSSGAEKEPSRKRRKTDLVPGEHLFCISIWVIY